jgi:ABC-type Fe3+ transport system permease subunit
MLACLTPLLLGFLLPAGLLLRMAVGEGDAQFGERFLMLARNSLTLSGPPPLAVALAVLAYSARLSKTLLAQGLNRLVGLGYAVPGTVIAVGVLIPVTRLDNWLAGQWEAWFGTNPGLLLTGGIAALIYAYLGASCGGASDRRRQPVQDHPQHGRRGPQPGPRPGPHPAPGACPSCGAACSPPACWCSWT